MTKDTLQEGSLQNSSRFDCLDQRTQRIISSRFDNSIKSRKMSALAEEVRDKLEILIQLVHGMDKANAEKRHRIRRTIADNKVDRGGVNEIMAKFEMLSVSKNQEVERRRGVEGDTINTLPIMR